MNYEGVIIDACIPRTEAERVSKLLDEAMVIINGRWKQLDWQQFRTDLYRKYYELEEEYRHNYREEDFEHWNELEDEVIQLINDLLPDDVVCVLHDDPGTVVIWDVRHDNA